MGCVWAKTDAKPDEKDDKLLRPLIIFNQLKLNWCAQLVDEMAKTTTTTMTTTRRETLHVVVVNVQARLTNHRFARLGYLILLAGFI